MNDDRLLERYRRMAQNNRWSNYRLLGACARLTDAERAAPRAGFFPSIDKTLNHILEVDIYYLVPLLEAERASAAAELPSALPPLPEGPVASFGALCQAQLSADLALIGLCERLVDAQLTLPVRWVRPELGRIAEMLENVLLHLFTHQIHHRGQLHAMLSSSAVAPPQLDEFYLEWDLELRQADLDAMLNHSHARHADS